MYLKAKLVVLPYLIIGVCILVEQLENKRFQVLMAASMKMAVF
jgi:hypothetical protein